jgi:hypothetical protein
VAHPSSSRTAKIVVSVYDLQGIAKADPITVSVAPLKARTRGKLGNAVGVFFFASLLRSSSSCWADSGCRS